MKSRLAEILKSKAFIAIALNVLFALFCVFCLVIKFEESDDFYLGAMLSGAFNGTPTASILFLNIILGGILKFLYCAFPALNWFVILPVILICTASALFCYALMERLGRAFGFAAGFVFLCFFTEDIYVMYQWTKAAAYLCGVGLFLVIWAIAQKRSIAFVAIGLFFCVFGTWIRREALFLVLPFLFIVFLYSCIWRSAVRKTVFALCCLALCFFASDAMQSLANSPAEYKQYAEYNGNRARVMDYKRKDQTDLLKAARGNGIDQQDLALLHNWIFWDPDVFSAKAMRDMSAAVAKNTDSRWWFIYRLLTSSRSRLVMGYPVFLAVLLLSIAVFFTNRRAMKWLVVFWLLTAAMYAYFICSGRLLYRLEYGLWLGAALGALWLLRPNGVWGVKLNCVLVLAIVLFQFPVYYPLLEIGRAENPGCTKNDREALNSLFFAQEYQSARYPLRPEKYGCYAGLKKEMDTHPERVYMFAELEIVRPQYTWFGALRAVPAGYFKNQIHLGLWTYPWPPLINSLKEIGKENPIKQVVDPDVYVVTAVSSPNIKSLSGYLEKRYYKNLRVKQLTEADGFGVYKFETLE